MELRQLEYLITVLEEGTFTAAAKRLHIVQSAVSHHVGKLEGELRVQLLRRERRGVSPTPPGELFVARARRILAEVAAAREELESFRGETVGTVTFGATIPAASLDVAKLLGAFRHSHSGVRVRLREGTGPELIEMVLGDSIDMAVVSARADQLPRGIDHTVVDIDHLVLVGPRGHPLEDYETVPMQELAGVDLITFREGAGLRDAAEAVLAAEGITPNVVIESNEMPVLLGLVSHGLGLAILPMPFIEQAPSSVWARPLDPPIDPPLLLIWRNNRRKSPATDAFLRHIIDFAPVRPGQPLADQDGTPMPV